MEWAIFEQIFFSIVFLLLYLPAHGVQIFWINGNCICYVVLINNFHCAIISDFTDPNTFINKTFPPVIKVQNGMMQTGAKNHLTSSAKTKSETKCHRNLIRYNTNGENSANESLFASCILLKVVFYRPVAVATTISADLICTISIWLCAHESRTWP